MKQMRNKLMLIIGLISINVCNAQSKNIKTDNVNIYGNCGMCETAIETAGNVKKVAKVDWNKDTKIATLMYDSTKTNQDEILKRIALAGYDSDSFLAPDMAYAKLPECCQYERVTKTMVETEEQTMITDSVSNRAQTMQKQEVNQLKGVFDNYFALKDALVKSDGKLASSLAKNILSSINSVQMNKLSTEEHTVWMKVMKELSADAEGISNLQDISKQRNLFSTLSLNMYQLMKVSKQETPIYFQKCPMYKNAKGDKGGNWLSKESGIKNPYFGSRMVTCGSTLETIE